ncbi:YIP1 family protein [Streptomyces sp. SID14478]|uniref:Yip1 family protein n=1 Tax=Streptomyces sp. SID14478 TaxID=2706073 RepID=UPI0013DB7FCB|nr:Yip1 family protein [Streptomyces sp. SID14478]NEB74121.1 YIP1 family protein [Streptomyces sp. SID14478]
MSQLSRNAGPGTPGPASRPAKPGTFEYVAGFRNGRGRDNREAPQGPPQAPPPYYGGGSQWPRSDDGRAHGHGHGEPEYFGDPNTPHPQGGYDPYAANNPGHTQQFSVNDDPYAYTQGATYQAGSAAAGPVGPRLHWKQLLSGVVLRPAPTYLQMRDYAMWAPALIVTFLYGLLAIFGFDGAREDVINATLSAAIPYVLTTGVAITLSFFVLGVVTHTLARQLGGDGAWQPTVGLSMLIAALTDTPRLIVGMFLGGDEGFVQLLGWATWLAAGALLTTMVAKSHDLPWPKALAASAIQLVALLSIIKLGTF